ncbi:PD-(D/E)XK motif protein [Serinibacter arcticus]|uniref:PD-(D/E)XK motif protein n=1 Tax=Serinibacter arcticus TaxID=1655435 RepID=UPI0010920F8B|nr:PD-(D/E)XK motif protein [Serinibacter arcticus]
MTTASEWTMRSDFVLRWAEMRGRSEVGYRELDPHHPFRRFFGMTSDGRISIAFLSRRRPPELELSDLVEVRSGFRQKDETWLLELVLLNEGSISVFSRLAVDLFARTEDAPDDSMGFSRLVEAVADWRRLLSVPQKVRLGEQAYRGLCAELHFLYFGAYSRTGLMRTAVDSWVGPLGAPQDFEFNDGNVEVKSVRPLGAAITISSAAQLSTEWSELLLVVHRVEGPLEYSAEGISAATLVESVRSVLMSEGGGAENLLSRLDRLGVDISDKYYTSPVRFLSETVYRVDEDFPRITVADVPAGVERVSYQLNLSSIASYIVASSEGSKA